MSIGAVLKQFFALVIVAGILVGAYAWYRINATQRMQNDHSITETAGNMLQFARKYPPAICTISYSGFDQSISATVYISSANISIDSIRYPGGKVMHEVINSGGDYTWSDNPNDYIYVADLTAKQVSDKVSSIDDSMPKIFQNMACHVWWFPDNQKFKIPDLREIKSVS